MKKLLTLAAILALVFTTCEQPTTEDDTFPSLTIINASSYDLTNVSFAGITFSASGSNSLPRSGGQATKQLTVKTHTGPISFNKVIDNNNIIECRTRQSRTIPDEPVITINDNTVVEQVGNSDNYGTLGQISFLSEVTVIHGTLPVAKNQNVNLGEGIIDRSRQFDFTLKNTGVGKLLLTAGGTEPIRISGDTANVFSIVQQPSSAEIAPNASLPFKIGFTPKEQQEYTASVTVISNDQSGDFTFTITVAGTPPKSVAEVYFNDNAVSQNGTIGAGEVLITHSKNITVEIRNTGTGVLTLDTANISITGTNAAAFTKITNPVGSIPENEQSSFIIKCEPTEAGENNAALTIPTNDSSRNPIVIILQMTAVRGSAVLELSQGSTIIGNNSLTPFDFGQVDVGINKSLVFTIKNTTGNIALELTGTPAVASSNAAFVVQTQPANKTISPGAEVSFLLQYTPTAEAEESASITIYNNSDSMVFTLNVKGTGYVKRPQITVQQGVSTISLHGEYNFGTVAAGKSSNITFTIGNSGDANLTFTTVDGNRVNLADNASGFFSVTQQPSASAVVTPTTGTANFVIRFSPTTAGSNFTATVLIKTNSRNNDEFAFTVKGTARAANSEARLSGMQFSAGTLVPQFNSSIYEYDLRIQAGPTLINVRPTSVDSNVTTIRVNGVSQASGILSQDIILASNNTVTIEVYAEDATSTATYTVNLKIVNTWERLHGASGRRYGIFRAISNGEGGIYASGYTSNSMAALFNIDGNGDLKNTFTYSSYNGNVGPIALGMAYNDYYSVYWDYDMHDYYITKTTSPSISPSRVLTSLTYNNFDVYLYPAGIVKDGWYYVAGNAHYAATTTATENTFGVFVNRHYNDGSYEKGKLLSITQTGIKPNTFEAQGMTLLTNGDVLLYGQAETTAGRKVAFASAVNISNTNAASWAVRWSNTYEIANKTSRFLNHFWDNSSNVVLVGDTDDGGFVVKFPGSVTTAAAAKPSGWPKVIAGTYTNGIFTGGLALSDGSGYIFVGSVGEGSGTGPYGGEDAWIVKTDLNVANKTWEKFFGGTGNDFCMAIVEQADCFILGGATNSPVIADQPRSGTEDVYILKINKDGTMD